ncbi:MAG: hypothetical protein ABSC23_00530 [Bryobacteraceae bacterium]|jgi:hypothetical protein
MMRRSFASAAALLVVLSASAPCQTKVAVFHGPETSHTWPLKEFDPALPSDWSGFNFLVLELRLSSPQRFELRIHDPGGVRTVRLSPVPGAWVRAAVPLDFLTKEASQGSDLASVHNKSRPMIFINLIGSPGPLTAVSDIEVSIPDPVGAPSLEIRSLRLAKEDPGDALLDAKPLVDEFGQWMADDWPGKTKTLAELKAAWVAEGKGLGSGDFNYGPYGGYKGTQAKATGFFRVEKIDGKWWILDPDGHYFWSAGMDCVTASSATRTAGREGLFTALPPATASSGGRAGSSFYTWNMVRRYGNDWVASWVDYAVRRMISWGFNTVGNWSDQRVADAHRVPYTMTLGVRANSGPMGVADVYAPEFEQAAERAAVQAEARKDDPYLLGYFLGNELPWPGRESVAADAILAGPDSPLQRELKKYLAAGDTPERRRAFLYRSYQKFVDTVIAAFRKHDPNHMVIGVRFGGDVPPDLVRASKAFDIFSINSYAYSVNQAEIEEIRTLIDRPVLIGEFHFGAPGRGMTPGLKQTASQEERGVAYRYYVENAAADASIVGSHWFQWLDEPNTGRSDGENYNIGFIDVADRPYSELVIAAQATHRRLLEVHSGKTPPVTRQAKTQ